MVDAAAEEESQHQALLRDALAQYRPRRQQRYSTVNVLLLTWAEDEIGIEDEVVELKRVFSEEFNYFVWRYEIPSKESQVELRIQIESFIGLWGSTDENLVIVFYTGHGGPNLDNQSSEFIWSAKMQGGPTLDWSIIHPLLLETKCDVVIILDCCFAGQAVRSHISHNIEFIAATDKDQFTPDGKDPERPSFTRVFTEQVSLMLREEGKVTIPGLVRRMVPKETGIIKQPFYVPLSPDSTSGPIWLTPWEPIKDSESGAKPAPGQSSPNTMFLRLSLFTPCDASIRQNLQRWMTQGSPFAIEDITVVERAVQDAEATEALVEHLLMPSTPSSSTVSFQWLPERAQSEASALLHDLETALHPPQSTQFEYLDATQVVQNLSKHSTALINFLQDNMALLDETSLSSLQDRIGNSSIELSKRIKMRLSLIREYVPVETSIVKFTDKSEPRQHIRTGWKDKRRVLIEYWYYDDALDSHHADADYQKASKQAARISAFLQEEMNESFRTLLGMGYVHETLHVHRLGFIYQLPADKAAMEPFPLSDLINRIKLVPLDVRARLAGCICQAMLNFHSIGWFHKAITSSNIIVFGEPGKSDENSSNALLHQMIDFSRPYIIGFDCSRPTDAESWSTNRDTTAERIYRHPDRWVGQLPFGRFHDLYALGILLIELGCWKTLPRMDPKKDSFKWVTKPDRLRDYLFGDVMKYLEHSAGTSYANATRYCIQKREWKEFEDWEVQGMIRRNVLQPLLNMHSQ
ncbi:hypothetical protein K491DRAFT_763840 [Lophiostoma macrostomum CBS 122681]|uniref:Protein kinase domain-containing protein n=1 Tax=Lophiostoma macrostomum CBS 122681 TaxID=1314788 RepID=A0A6A6SLW5_9PLEO|nr:hypothetical protein K491DRAFT_763840 [Lophiostoma macrostomum CBS 122681]